MNQPLNNIRSILAKHKEHIPVKVVAEILAEIDGEEAEVCEWKLDKKEYLYVTSCGHYCDNHGYNFCSWCGKEIKVNETDI